MLFLKADLHKEKNKNKNKIPQTLNIRSWLQKLWEEQNKRSIATGGQKCVADFDKGKKKSKRISVFKNEEEESGQRNKEN